MRVFRFLIAVMTSLCSFSISQNVPVYMALRQRNTELLKDMLHRISDPTSTGYGEYYTKTAIHHIIDPPKSDQDAVINWIKSNKEATHIVNYGDAIYFRSSKTSLFDMFSINSEMRWMDLLRGYKLPSYLEHIIDFVEMDIVPQKFKQGTRDLSRQYHITKETEQCDDRYFGREPMLKLYNVSNDTLNHEVIGVLAEFQSNAGFMPSDLVIQQSSNNQTNNAVTHIVGKNVGIDVESVLDVQLMSQAGNNIELWFWDSPYWLFSFTVDYFNTEHIGDIISMSWGWAQDSQCDIIDCSGSMTSKKYVERVNVEFMKIALRGVTIVVSSGDAGAPGRTNEQCLYDRPINPVFPGSSPYVTSIGASYVPYKKSTKNASTPLCQDFGCIVSTDERSISYDKIGWTTGGGFDLYENTTPWWQSYAIKQYLATASSLPNSSLYNVHGRAYPDITTVGHSCPVYIRDQVGGVDGTSCSAPVSGGLLGVIANHLWVNYHLKLGFANPLLYYIHRNCPECFRDITIGYNWCTEQQCCENKTNFGFTASMGFDPVSGLGSLNVGNIKQFIDSYIV